MRQKYPYAGVKTLFGLFSKTRNAFREPPQWGNAQALVDTLGRDVGRTTVTLF